MTAVRTLRGVGRAAAGTDLRQRRLESLAAEFALLAQRRARVSHQLGLLDDQRSAAAANLSRLQSRLGWLAARMRVADPDLAGAPAVAAPAPPPPPVPVVPEPMPGGRRWLAARPGLQAPARPGAGKWRG